jgi:glycosyltransferase involved in cell wall biosynthesis
MNTLHLTNWWHAESGGVATFYRALLHQAEAERHPICLVVPAAEDRVEMYGKCCRIYEVRGRLAPFRSGYRVITPATYVLPTGQVRRILAEERPDLVECSDKYTLNYLAGLLRRGWLIRGYRPAVVGLTCERMDESVGAYISSSRLARRFCRTYMRWLYFPLFDHHIAVSLYTADELREVAAGHYTRRGVWVRPMGTDCKLFTSQRRSAGFRRRLEALSGAPEGSTLLLYTGRLAPEKNLQLLFHAMRLLEQRYTGQFHLLIAGEGPLRASLEQDCARELPGAVCFLGYIHSREMLADIYANCDMLLHPNPREPFGIAPLEAMASALPVIAPNSGGITSYANSDNAWLVNPDPESFALAAITLREGCARAGTVRSEGRKTAERFDWPSVASSFFSLYEELYAIVQGERNEPAMAPAFCSTYRSVRRRLGWEL